jgi:hypothetical protein
LKLPPGGWRIQPFAVAAPMGRAEVTLHGVVFLVPLRGAGLA